MHTQVVHQVVHHKDHQAPKRLPYILLRGDTFYFRFKVPPHHRATIKRGEIRISLRTDSVKKARLLIQSKLHLIEEIKRFMSNDNELLFKLYNELTDFRSLEGLSVFQRESYAEGAQAVADEIRSSISDGFSYNLNDGLSSLKAKPDGDPSHDYLSLLIELLELRAERASSGISPQLKEKHKEVKETLEYLTGDGSVAVAHTQSRVKTPLLSEVWREYRADRIASGWKEKVISAQESLFSLNISILGDKPVGDYTKKDMKVCLTTLRKFPKKTLKAYKNISFATLLEKLDSYPEADRMAPKTAREYFKQLQGIFSTYLTHEKGVLEKSPTEGVTAPSDGKRVTAYPPFSVSEVNKILKCIDEDTLKLQPYEKWFVRLAFYSGMRSSEIRNVKKSDVKQDPDGGGWFILIPDAKTQAGVRKVPIHKVLIKEGFVGFAQGSTDERFLDLAVNKQHHYLRLLRRICQEVSVSMSDDFGSNRVFHSIRHTVITHLTAKSVSDPVLQALVGHEISQRGLTNRYTHKHLFPVTALLAVVNQICYS